MTYKEWKNEVIEEYNDYLEMQKLIKQNREECDEHEECEEEVITAPKKSSEEVYLMNVKAIDEWIEYGGFINYADTKNGVELYTGEAAEVDYYFWLNEVNEEKLADTISNQKAFCKTALKNANVPDEVIEELLSNW